MKLKVVAYRDGFLPRIYINPTKKQIKELKKHGEVLLNPNMGSVRGIALEHTYPDVKNNLIRPIPLAARTSTKLKNVAEKPKPKQKASKLYVHLTILAYAAFGFSAAALHNGGAIWLIKQISLLIS